MQTVSDDVYFDCAKMRCRMPVATCLMRRKTIRTNARGSYNLALSCGDCNQGAELEKGHVIPAPQNVIPAEAGIRNKTKGEKVMQKKACANCKRVMSIVKEGRCFICAKAAEGKRDEALVAALVDVRERIQSGNIRRGGSRPRTEDRPSAPESSKERFPAAAVPAPVPAGILLQGKPDETSEPQTVIPVTLRLTVEIAVRVNGIV